VPAQLIALAAALSYAISGIAAKRGLRYSTPITVTLVSVAIHATVLWIALLIFRGVPMVSWWVLFLFVLSGLIQPILRFLTYAGIHYVGAAAGTTLRGAHPLVSTSLAILFLGESLNLLIVLGTISIVAGVALISWQGDKKQASFRWWHLAYPLSAAFLAGVSHPPATLHTKSCERAALPRGGHRHRGTPVAGQCHSVARTEAKAGVGSPRDGTVSNSGNVRNTRYPAGDRRLECWPRSDRLPDRRHEPVVDCARQLAISARYRTINAAHDSRSRLRRGGNNRDFNRSLMKRRFKTSSPAPRGIEAA
jgi:uncharacterized membrane protein